MNETLSITLALMAGIALGITFFGGLWLTVKKIVTAKVPALWVISSFIFRLGIVLPGFYLISSGRWQRLVACLLGFIAGKFIIIHFTKTNDVKTLHLKKEDMHGA